MNAFTKTDASAANADIANSGRDRIRAMIVDDNAIDRRRLKSMCDKADLDMEFLEAESIAEMQAALKVAEFDLIFIDYRLDDGDGLGALSLIKKDRLNGDAATIMVAGVGQTAIAVSALKSGCSDYILKESLDPQWLKRAVTNAVDKSRLQRQYDSSELARASLTEVLQRFSKECTLEMKPILSRMLREIRTLSTTLPDPGRTNCQMQIDALNKSCQDLWSFSAGIERAAEHACKIELGRQNLTRQQLAVRDKSRSG